MSNDQHDDDNGDMSWPDAFAAAAMWVSFALIAWAFAYCSVNGG